MKLFVMYLTICIAKLRISKDTDGERNVTETLISVHQRSIITKALILAWQEMLRSYCCAGSAGMRNMSFQYQHHQHEVRHIRLNTTTTFCLFETKEKKKKLHLSDFSVNKLKGKFGIIYPQLTSPVYISLSLVSDTEFCVHTAHTKEFHQFIHFWSSFTLQFVVQVSQNQVTLVAETS